MKIRARAFLMLTLSLVLALNTLSLAAVSNELTVDIADSLGNSIASNTVAAADNISIKGSANPGELLLITIVKPGKKIEAASDSNISDIVYYMTEVYADHMGSYTSSYSFGSCPTGEYLLAISSEEGSRALTKMLTVVNEAEQNATIDAINSAADSGDIADIFIKSSGARNLMFDTSAFDRLSSSGKEVGLVFDKFYAESSKETVSLSKLGKYKDIFESYSALALYNQEKTLSVLDEFSSVFKLAEHPGVSESLAYITDSTKKENCKKALASKGYSDILGLRKEYGALVCLSAVREAAWTSFDKIITQSAASFTGLDMSSYTSLSSKSSISTYMKEKAYTDVASFVSGFNAKVKELLALQNNPPKPGSTPPSMGGGSGGMGGSGGIGGSGGGMNIEGGSFAPLPVEAETVFNDTNGVPWAIEGIDYLYKKGIVNGVSANSFEPDRFVTREEFVKMLVLVVKAYDSSNVSDFADVPLTHWSAPYVASAVKTGLINGIGDNSFGLGRSITRQDACVSVYRAMSDVKKGNSSVSFTDTADIADYAKEAVDFMASLGIINGMGDGSFAPLANMTRAQAAKVLYELSMLIGG